MNVELREALTEIALALALALADVQYEAMVTKRTEPTEPRLRDAA